MLTLLIIMTLAMKLSSWLESRRDKQDGPDQSDDAGAQENS